MERVFINLDYWLNSKKEKGGIEMILNIQGIVLRSVKYKENDLILTIFSKTYGRVSAIARRAQSPKSKLLSCSQLFSYNSYVLKKQGSMFTIYQSENIKSFYNISMDIESYSYCTFILKLVEMNIEEGQAYTGLFDLLAKTLFLYSEGYENKPYLLDIFIFKFLKELGLQPQVSRCTSCSRTNYDYAAFSIEDGGIVCNKCMDKDKFYIKIDQTTISLMQYLSNNDIIVCSKANVSIILVKELFYLLKRYLAIHLDNVDFRPLDMLKNIDY